MSGQDTRNFTPPCRSCGTSLRHVFADLGNSPLSNSYRKPHQLHEMEPYFPLKAYACSECLLVQLEVFETPENIFTDYAYFSSYSTSWLSHCQAYVDTVSDRFNLGKDSKVIEVASNDGYLLQYFVRKGIPVLGIEPAANVAAIAEKKGVPTHVAFFGARTANQVRADSGPADLIAANNVLAHVPDINDFVAGFAALLKQDGVATFEFPHLLQLIRKNQFDTIYHEHFSYLSLYSVGKVFERHGMKVFDVEEVPTHGGSLRLFVKLAASARNPVTERVGQLIEREREAGLLDLRTYLDFQKKVCQVKRELLKFLIEARESGKSVVGYGAPAKGNTLLNYCGVDSDLLAFTVDKSPHKQGLYLPGVRIPIHSPQTILERRPDFVLVLPWNLTEEITQEMAAVKEWGAKFVVAVPKLTVVES